MYWCSYSIGFYDLAIVIKILHVIIVCCIPLLEECVVALIGIHHDPRTLYMLFHDTYNYPNEIQELDAILRTVVLILPLGSFYFSLKVQLALIYE